MTDPQFSVDSPGLEAGDIVGVPFCAVCDARESPRTPLTQQQDGTYLCPTHIRTRMREGLRGRGAGALTADGALAPIGPSRPAPPPDSPYETLDTPPDSTAEEIEAARKKLQQYWLPRRSGALRGQAEEMLDRIAAAYDELIDPQRRRTVDEGIRQRAIAAQEARLLERVTPLEDWPGRHIASLKDFETACETSLQDWRIGEGILLSGGLYTWARYSLQNRDAQQALERITSRADLSGMRRLNEFLYRIDPDRSYRFFMQPGVFAPVKEDAKVHSLESFIEYADAHWDTAVQHLFDGELVTWLEPKASLGVYGGEHYDLRTFFDRECARFAHTSAAGVGLEMLLEFMDNDLPKPKIRVTFDGQENGYSLLNWDGEIAHRPVTMTIQNTTRGYYLGQVTLEPPSTPKEASRVPWVSLSYLPAEAPTLPNGSLAPSADQRSPQVTNIVLNGATSQAITFHLGHFNALKRGRHYFRTVTLQRYETSPTQMSFVGSFPLSLRLMRFLAGYRLALWARGLRGGVPGMLLNGGAGYLIGWLLVLIGLAVAPHESWNFFSHTTDFSASGSPTFMGALDLVLTLALRPFYFAIAVFGYQVPNLFAVFFGFFGFFVARGRGHTKYTRSQDKSGVRLAARFLALYLVILASVILIVNLANHQFYSAIVLPVAGGSITVQLIAFVFSSATYFPPAFDSFPWSGFSFYAVFFSGVSAIIAGRIIVALRQRLYKWVDKSAGALLNPPDKG